MANLGTSSMCAICRWHALVLLLCNSGILTQGNGVSRFSSTLDSTNHFTGQAHMQARYAILRVFLSAGPEFCELQHTKDDLSDLTIKLDRTKIQDLGRPAVDKFLQKLHVFKATADLEEGKKLYEDITNVDEWWATKLRPEVIRQAKPRRVFVQANTVLEGDKVVLKEYEATPEGMIQSFVDRDYI